MDIGTFADWVTIGASIGIKGFFAVAVFLAFCAAILGLIGLLSNVAKGVDDGDEKHRPF